MMNANKNLARQMQAKAGTSMLVMLFVLPIGLSLLVLGGCASSSHDMVEFSSFHAFTEEELAQQRQLTQDRFRINSGDVIAVDFKYQDELDKEDILILPDGRFTIAGIDNILAAGLTISELDSALTEEFARDYRNPELSITVQELGGRKVYVFGEVNRPGGYDLDETFLGVLPAIAMAGGFTSDASTSQVLIIRVKPDGYEYKIADISHLEKRVPQGLVMLDIQANDIVYVPRSALGDLKYFSDTFLAATLRITDIFWDIYAINHLEKVDRLVR